ncbi:hypothetical protein F4780DRAFT_783717 [Xylariomycetidae sp. FL0641]|nr:hypothetical protein F4780DRAFT_783717 [Xylariomycetidae sp. FL0641]
MDKKKKLVFQLDTPYASVSWPGVDSDSQQTILELLCSLLAPIGKYRLAYVKPSQGKRAKKRKRREASESDKMPLPPTPELLAHIDVGLPAVTRRLQDAISRRSNSSTSKTTQPLDNLYSVIVIARSGQPNAFNDHLPQMVAMASKSHPSHAPIRLVGLSKACEDRLSEALGIPRASCIAIYKDAPNSKALVDYARQHVPILEMPWFEEASQAEYQETKINTIETFVGSAKQRILKP